MFVVNEIPKTLKLNYKISRQSHRSLNTIHVEKKTIKILKSKNAFRCKGVSHNFITLKMHRHSMKIYIIVTIISFIDYYKWTKKKSIH